MMTVVYTCLFVIGAMLTPSIKSRDKHEFRDLASVFCTQLGLVVFLLSVWWELGVPSEWKP
mgnify:CR=1 FL=1